MALARLPGFVAEYLEGGSEDERTLRNNISAFGVCVHGQLNVPLARQWVDSFFIPAVLPMLIDRLRAENDAAFAENAAHPAWHWRKKLLFSASRSRAKRR